MATIEELEAGGTLLRHLPDLESWEMPERCLLYPPSLDVWVNDVLQGAPKVRGRNMTPFEQVEQLFYDYVVGSPMTYSVGYRKLEPIGLHVWELKTEDVRIFGWFLKKCHFIATGGEFKDNLSNSAQNKSTNKLYKPHIDAVVAFRETLNLNPPKLTTAVVYNDVL